ncbi:hypothetical protein AAW51_5162 [Caldimonas brevitalea]|uniref:Ice-binding protein C-terminal domain-containing protein n=1 Tax=Caldimonas brevitalea TaxID=413882 RepID=A0A0G3BV23_9BURK|nr:hypothetical protein AAW51_5162 [Caldimonas brevitalea]
MLALAVQAALFGGPVLAADTAWTGGAAQPYWDLAGNWSAGAPTGAATRALLGAADTTLRSGAYEAAQVTGTGTLNLTGGSLRLHAAGSTLGRLHLAGGAINGGGQLAVQTLDWAKGDLLGNTQLVVKGSTRISGEADHYLDYGASLTLQGDTHLDAGNRSVGLFGKLTLAQGAVFHDEATQRDRSLTTFAGFQFDGHYRKTGNATTRIGVGSMASFQNNGVFEVQQGKVHFDSMQTDAGWENNGLLKVHQGAAVTVQLQEPGSFVNRGQLQVDGQMALETWEKAFRSAGTVRVGKTGEFKVSSGYVEEPTWFDQGLHNDGKVVLTGIPQSDTRPFEPQGTFYLSGPGLTGTGTTVLQDAYVAAGDLRNDGTVKVVGASELHVNTFVQDSADAAFWLQGGSAEADRFSFLQGEVGAGDEGLVSGGALIGELVFGDATLAVDLAGGDADQLFVTGSVLLDGTLALNFLDTPTLGTFRLLEVDGSLSGSFATVLSNLDPSLYRYTLSYGTGSLDLTVAAVPEPETYALIGLGLVAVMGWSRRRAARRST